MNMNLYPANSEVASKADISKNPNPSISIYGDRIHADQTLYEYLIEFLLVFASAKNAEGEGKLAFHEGEPLHYYVEPRNGFRRFVFFEQAKRSKVPEDADAYKDIVRYLGEHVEAKNDRETHDFLLAVQQLFRGYAAVLKKRTWCAQELLPLCPEMLLCEEMPNDRFRSLKKNQENYECAPGCDSKATFFDDSFDLTRHNFLARGGEIYYLHLMQVLNKRPEKKALLEKYLQHLLTEKSQEFSQLANWIQTTWEQEAKLDKDRLVQPMNLGFIPAGAYLISGNYAADELITFLSNELHPVKRIELLAKGMMFQILRMQLEQTANYLGDEHYPLIVDMRSKKGGAVIRQLSVKTFNRVADAFTNAINNCIAEGEEKNEKDTYATYVKAKKESLDVFRTKGKELQCIIPSNGPFERFSLSEDVTRFLVLSIVKPGERMDLDQFLKALYEHFNLIIGPEEFITSSAAEVSTSLVNSFLYNREAFQEFLKSAGFLRDLSDATSIVVNPYKEVELE